MHKVLIVEDAREFQEDWAASISQHNLADKVQFIPAYTVQEAHAVLVAHPDIHLVAVDGTLESAGDGLDLVENLDIFHSEVPIIAILSISSDREMRQRMMKAGCTYECDKKLVFKNILKILGITLSD